VAALRQQLFQLYKDNKKTITAEETRQLADHVLLSSVAVPFFVQTETVRSFFLLFLAL
jgi:hypothetical protein